MHTIPCPSRDQARDHLAIAVGPPKPGLSSHTADDLDRVMSLYDLYDAIKGAPDDALLATDLDTALTEAISRGYSLTHRRRSLECIRTFLLSSVERCPLCGIGAPIELDHYLPRSTFKALAIYIRNLVPVCHECNREKLDHVSTPGSPRLMHPYLEPLPQIRFLDAAVSLGDGSLSVDFRVDPSAALSEAVRERLQHQLQLLNLNDRYQREINTYLASQATGLKLAFEGGGSVQVKSYLEAQASVYSARFHANYWIAILMFALSLHAPFCGGAFRDLFTPCEMEQAPVL